MSNIVSLAYLLIQLNFYGMAPTYPEYLLLTEKYTLNSLVNLTSNQTISETL